MGSSPSSSDGRDRTTMTIGSRTAPAGRSRPPAGAVDLYRLDARRRHRAPPEDRQDPAREPAAARRHARRVRRRRRRARRLARTRAKDIAFMPGSRADAGLHGRARGRRPGRDALGDGAQRRRPVEGRSARSRRPDHRPLGAGRPVPHAKARTPRTSSGSTGATRSATRSSAGRSRRSTGCASCRRARASATR